MSINIKIADKAALINENGLYTCPKCNCELGKVFNIHNDNLYSLQCPNNREHCYRKNNISSIDAMPYNTIQNIKRCNICDAILVYTEELYLVCPNNASHIAPIKTSISDIERLGYLPKNQL